LSCPWTVASARSMPDTLLEGFMVISSLVDIDLIFHSSTDRLRTWSCSTPLAALSLSLSLPSPSPGGMPLSRSSDLVSSVFAGPPRRPVAPSSRRPVAASPRGGVRRPYEGLLTIVCQFLLDFPACKPIPMPRPRIPIAVG
jgi:hypothetical protein